jgi:FkbM family methyltransferase
MSFGRSLASRLAVNIRLRGGSRGSVVENRGYAQMARKIHQFDNGVQVFDDHLIKEQRARYQRHNVHEKDEEDLFISIVTSLPQEAVYVSVGTAIGYYPLLAKKIRSDLLIHCFEPLPRHLKYLDENIELNGFSSNDFHVHRFAISMGQGEALFVDHSYGSSLVGDGQIARRNQKSILLWLKNALKISWTGRRQDRYFSVPALPLSQIFEIVDEEKIDLLQMDIQGFEGSVLDAYFVSAESRRKRIEQFLVGTHGPEIHEKCKRLLENAGFRILRDDYDTKHQPDGILLGALAPEAKHPISHEGPAC